jgi:hypothetical protein
MKHFKDIREGLLKGQSNTLADGESAAEAALKEQMMQYFLRNTDIARNKKNSFIRFISDDARDSLIDKSCSFDGSVITVDLTKLKKDTRIKICTFNGGSDLPLIKIIDKAKTVLKNASQNFAGDHCSVIIYSCDDSVVDVNNFIHPETNVSSIAYDKNGTRNCIFAHNSFPGTVRDLMVVDCMFETINPKKWPSCSLWFSQDFATNIFLETIGKHNTNCEFGYPTRNIFIK